MNRDSVIKWVKDQDIRASSHTREITLDQQEDWLFDGEIIHHRLRRFFSIAGLEYSDNRSSRAQPLILQPEIGCLGWVIRCMGTEPAFLLQAKYEPGNCNGIQIAPTVQATKSNQDRVHGGSEITFLGLFESGGASVVIDSLQTEESDRFFRKVNRNVTVQIDGELAHPEHFHWCSLETLKRLLSFSHTVNTDARSVLACMDWHLFQAAKPADGALSGMLLRSLELERDPSAVHQRLDAARAAFGEVRRVSLSKLPGWRHTPSGLEASDGPFSIRYFQIRTQLREVPEWNQPLVLSHSNGMCLLALCLRDGVAWVYLRIRQAPGVLDGAEIGPSFQLPPGQSIAGIDPIDEAVLDAASRGRILAEADNSQEGSRFFKDCIRYRVAMVDPDLLPETDGAVWATLGTLKNLIDRGKIVSNEMRSAVSFLLPLL